MEHQPEALQHQNEGSTTPETGSQSPAAQPDNRDPADIPTDNSAELPKAWDGFLFAQTEPLDDDLDPPAQLADPLNPKPGDVFEVRELHGSGVVIAPVRVVYADSEVVLVRYADDRGGFRPIPPEQFALLVTAPKVPDEFWLTLVWNQRSLRFDAGDMDIDLEPGQAARPEVLYAVKVRVLEWHDRFVPEAVPVPVPNPDDGHDYNAVSPAGDRVHFMSSECWCKPVVVDYSPEITDDDITTEAHHEGRASVPGGAR